MLLSTQAILNTTLSASVNTFAVMPHGIVRLGQEKLADLIISRERGIDKIGCYRWK
jgi:hypothetical protein